jgi:hypothetical protein
MVQGGSVEVPKSSSSQLVPLLPSLDLVQYSSWHI